MSSKKPIVIGVVLLLAIAGGITAWRMNHDDANEDGSLTLYGNVDQRQAQLAFEVAGRIDSISTQEGQTVKKGEVLAQLDNRRLQQAVDQANALVEAQQEVVNGLEAGTRPEEISKAKADLELAKAKLANAQKSYTRISDLAKRDMASKQQRDDAEAALKVSTAQMKAAEAAQALALAGPRKEDIAAAKASLQASQAQLAQAQTNLTDATLTAPSDGMIQNRLLEPGDMASPQQPVFTLALTQPMWVRAYVAETQLGELREGMPAEISSDSFPDKRYPGWVGYISPTAQFTPKSVEAPGTRTDLVYEIRIYTCDKARELRLGMPVTVHINPADHDKNGVHQCE